MLSLPAISPFSAHRREVVIHEGCRKAYVETADVDLVAPFLTRTQHSYRSGGPRGFRRVSCTKAFFREMNGRIIFPAGIVSWLAKRLLARGLTVRLVNEVHWQHLHLANRDLLNDGRLIRDDRDILSALAQHPRCQIIVPTVADIGRIGAWILDLFPEYRIFFAVRNKRVAAQIHAEMQRHTQRRVALFPDRPWGNSSPWAMVGTRIVESLGDLQWGIVVVCDFESAIKPAVVKHLRKLQNLALYSIRCPDAYLHEDDRFRLECVYGPIIFSSVPGQIPLTARVALVPYHLSTSSRRRLAAVEKGELIWRSAARNGLIATIANQLEEDRALLGSSGDTTPPSDLHFAILIENAEHARHLHQFLPTWPMHCAPTDFSSWIAPVREIVTHSYAEHHGISCDMLIRADGGVGMPLTAGKLSGTRNADQICVIDIADMVRAEHTHNTQSRLDAYRKAGWIFGDTPATQ